VRLANEACVGMPADEAWAAVAGGTWAGAVEFAADGYVYAGAWRLVDIDEDERRATIHGQARRLLGWGGVTATFEARPTAPGSRAPLALEGEALLSGHAGPQAAVCLAEMLEVDLDTAALTIESPADDPAWRRKLALRAALAVGVGVAAGLAGAAWDRRRRS
jgi:hypothetical protein